VALRCGAGVSMDGVDAGNVLTAEIFALSSILPNATVVLSARAQTNVVIEFFIAKLFLNLVFVLFDSANLARVYTTYLGFFTNWRIVCLNGFN
jgi:hypothetical protein